jgi:hypothetical protein
MASIKVTTKIKTDLKGLNKLASRFKKDYDSVAHVGHFGGKYHTDQGLTIAEVSYINQKGHGNVPDRPYMEIAMTSPAFMKAYQASQSRVAKELVRGSLVKGKRVSTVVDHEVKLLAEILREVMVGVIEASTGLGVNSPKWAAEKGHNRPLMDTFTMVSDITSAFMRDLKVNHTIGVETVERGV